MKSKKLTIYEIAEIAGVSIATVSRYINEETRHKVAPATCELIEKIIRRHGYTPSLAAKYLSCPHFKTIGIVFPHHYGMLASDYYTAILTGVSDALLETDYRMKMILLKPDKGPWDHYDFRRGESVDGLILTYWRSVFSDAASLKRFGIPCAIINNVEKNINAHFVAGDHYDGGHQAGRYLTVKGHRHILVLSGTEGAAPDVRYRLSGFKAGLREAGIQLAPDAVIDVGFREDRAYTETERLLAENKKVTAIFCMNDIQAFGVLRRLEELGIDCPGRLSVMAYDDDRRSEHTHPPLTTVRVPVDDLAKRAAQDLISHIRDPKPHTFFKPVIFPVKLIERASVRPL